MCAQLLFVFSRRNKTLPNFIARPLWAHRVKVCRESAAAGNIWARGRRVGCFYRVDYTLGLLLAGFVAGLLLSRRTSQVASARLAQYYYVAVAALVVPRIILSVCSILTSHPGWWPGISGAIGDLSGIIFGVVLGLAIRRENPREFLGEPAISAALCMGLAFSFAMSGVSKAFAMAPMTEFFTQSGYPVTFLKFIMIAEVIGAVGLLLPWAFLPAVAGLTIDMLGAIVTHVHNGDSLNDSSGAIGALIRLAAVAIFWTWRPDAGRSSRTVRSSLIGVGVVALICLLIALGGSFMIRHLAG